MLLVSFVGEVVQWFARFTFLIILSVKLRKVRHYLRYHTWCVHSGRLSTSFLFLSVLLVALAACSGGATATSSTTNGALVPAARQVLRFPNGGISDSGSLDPALGPERD